MAGLNSYPHWTFWTSSATCYTAKERHKQALFSPSAWQEDRHDERTTPCQVLQQKNEALWSHKNDHKWTDDQSLRTKNGHKWTGDHLRFDHQFQSLCDTGQFDTALGVLFRMEQQNVDTFELAYRFLLNSCIDKRSIVVIKHVHRYLALYGLHRVTFLSECVVAAFAKCGNLKDALQVFRPLPCRTVFGWTVLISAYTDSGHGQKALDMYQCMLAEGVEPSNYTLVSLLKACIHMNDLGQGKIIHMDAQAKGLDSDVFVASILINMYGRCGSIVDAETVFYGLSIHDLVTWTAMLSAYLEKGQGTKALQLYKQLEENGLSSDERSIIIALQACCIVAEDTSPGGLGQSTECTGLDIGRELHGEIAMKGVDSNPFIASSLVNTYGKYGSTLEAENVFCGLSELNAVPWTTMLHAYVGQKEGAKALRLYRQMEEFGVNIDRLAFLALVQVCTISTERDNSQFLEEQFITEMLMQVGCALHAASRRAGLDSDVFLGSALISMYGKYGCIAEAENVFSLLLERDGASWNAMLSAYVENGDGKTPLQLYRQMQEEGINIDEWTLVTALQACLTLVEREEIVEGCSNKLISCEISRALQIDAQRKNLDSNQLVRRTLVIIFGKCGSILDAENMFHGLSLSKIASWNVMLTAYVEQGLWEPVLHLYRQMEEDNITMDNITLICVLQACGGLGDVEICREVHFAVVSSSNAQCLVMATTLVHAYGNCARMLDAQAVFEALPQPDVALWNALITAYARVGDGSVSLQKFEEMLLAGVKPNELTFLPVLSVCSHAGLVDKGLEYFESMIRDYRLTPGIEQYSSILDLLARAGDFVRVIKMLSLMPMQADLATWMLLLSACLKHGSVEIGKYAFDHVVQLDPEEAAAYVMMSNIYADAGLWDCISEVNRIRSRQGV